MREIEADGASRPAVCHCLLLETDSDGLILIDTGLGTPDVTTPERTLSPEFLGRAQPVFDLAETALHQIRRLGHEASDVRHIVLTHLDLDHAGGLPDFPDARVHLMDAEHRTALASTGRHPEDRIRYRPAQWAHHPNWVTYTPSAANPGTASTPSAPSKTSTPKSSSSPSPATPPATPQ
ncbi:MBL fold metallo-hydrolase [Catenulispora yoronensis]